MPLLDRQPEVRPHPGEAARLVPVYRIVGNDQLESTDALAVEEPLEIQLAYRGPAGPERRNLAITMRTPGQDYELAVGFLFTEGIIRGRGDLAAVDALPSGAHRTCRRNRIRVTLQDHVAFDPRGLERNFYTTSSCGVCGKASIQALRTRSPFPPPPPGSPPIVRADLLLELPDRIHAAQEVFQATGGLHASGLFDASGRLLALREDVGRHNAMDKLIGSELLAGRVPLAGRIVLVSGRVSFELVQKASMAGLRFLAAVGAPSSLAAELAREAGMTLVGWLRDGRFNVYHGAERIT